jgi:hypothetical protein
VIITVVLVDLTYLEIIAEQSVASLVLTNSDSFFHRFEASVAARDFASDRRHRLRDMILTEVASNLAWLRDR